MGIVDSQCHVSRAWYEPVETLIEQMDRNGVAQAVLVQMLGELDNTYQQACTQKYPERFASVVAVDPGRADACAALTALAADGAAGLRLRPDARSPNPDPLALWRTAASLGLAISCVGTAEQFCTLEFFDLIETLPSLVVVLEHLGGTSQAGATDLSTRRRVIEIARFPNVYLKLPGLGELVPRPTLMQRALLQHEPAPQTPASRAQRIVEIELALEGFGPERLMWGSDFPVVGSREGYANALGWTREAIAAIGADALDPVFGDTARTVFKLPRPRVENDR